MSGQTGHIKETLTDDNGFRKFIINCLGLNDNRKYFSLSPFGYDFNTPENTRSLTLDSKNKDVKFSIGVLNKVKVDDLNPGECVIFSTDETGETLVSKTVYRNTGDIEINKDMDNGNIIIKVDGTIEFNGSADFLTGFTKNKEGFDTAIEDLNKTNAELNKIITALTNWTPTPNDGGLALKTLILANPPTNVIDSTASIDDSKKENLKCE